MMKFTGPKHITEVYAPSGPVVVKDGMAELPDNAPSSDVDAMRRAGFSPEVKVTPAAKAPAADQKDD